MRMQALITNHGKHSDEKLGYAISDDIIQIAADATGQDAMDGRKLANQIGDICAKHMRELADREHDGLKANCHDHLMESLEAHPEAADSLEKEIVDAGNASPLASWFDKPETLANVHQAVHKWIRAAQHMHRDWFARHGKVGHGAELSDDPGHDPDHEHVKMWKDLHDAPSEQAYREALHKHATSRAG